MHNRLRVRVRVNPTLVLEFRWRTVINRQKRDIRRVYLSNSRDATEKTQQAPGTHGAVSTKQTSKGADSAAAAERERLETERVHR